MRSLHRNLFPQDEDYKHSPRVQSTRAWEWNAKRGHLVHLYATKIISARHVNLAEE